MILILSPLRVVTVLVNPVLVLITPLMIMSFKYLYCNCVRRVLVPAPQIDAVLSWVLLLRRTDPR